MATWKLVSVMTEFGERWVVENDKGFQQHYGYQYDDKTIAERWVEILNALHRGWDEDRKAQGVMQ